MCKGISHKAIAQLDKHSDEQSLQRVSSEIIEACSEVSKLIKTEVPELRRPWSAEMHDKVMSPLFLSVSFHGIVYFTDDNSRSFVCYRQNPLPRKLIFLSQGRLDCTDDDDVPFSPDTTDLKNAKWQMISGVALIDTTLLVSDSKLGKIRIVKQVDKLLQNPRKVLQVSNMNLSGLPNHFHPFAIGKVSTRNDRILVTDPVRRCVYLLSISDTRDYLTALRIISCNDSLVFPVDCLCFGGNVIIITEGRLDREDSAAIKFMLLDDITEHVEFNFTLPSQESSLFGLCEMGDKVFCSDHGSHCIYELNINRDVLVVAGRLDANGTDDGYICSPSGLASRGGCLYFAEHPLDRQGAIRVLHSLEGLASFQTIWQGISQSMGMVSKLHAIRDKDEAGL